MIWAAGIEPAACGFQVRHSTKLSYAQAHAITLRLQRYGRAGRGTLVHMAGRAAGWFLGGKG